MRQSMKFPDGGCAFLNGGFASAYGPSRTSTNFHARASGPALKTNMVRWQETVTAPSGAAPAGAAPRQSSSPGIFNPAYTVGA